MVVRHCLPHNTSSCAASLHIKTAQLFIRKYFIDIKNPKIILYYFIKLKIHILIIPLKMNKNYWKITSIR